MKTTKQMIEIMTAYDNGAEIEYSVDDTSNYTFTSNPNWDWNYCDYRIKKQKKTVIIEKRLYKHSMNDGYFVVEADLTYHKNVYADNRIFKILDTYEVEL